MVQQSSLWSIKMVHGAFLAYTRSMVTHEPGYKILDQTSLYVIPSVRSNHNENMLLLTEGHLG
jgi:hypothetical protein